MDVNGTRFHLLHGPTDWAPLAVAAANGSSGVVWNEDLEALTLRPLLYRYPEMVAFEVQSRRGVAIDGFGHGYRISEDERSIEIVPASGPPAQRFWPPLPENTGCSPIVPAGLFSSSEVTLEPPPSLLRGLAVTVNHYLVAGVLEPPGLLVFDLHAGGPPACLPWPGEGPFRPFDMAPRTDGGIWILDTEPSTETAEPRYWAMDRYMRLESQPSESVTGEFADLDFIPSDGSGETLACTPPVRVESSMGWPLAGRPISIEGMPDGSLLVLEVDSESGDTSLARYAAGTLLGRAEIREPLLDQFVAGADEDELMWQGHDMAFVPEPLLRTGQMRGALFVVGADGNQAFAFTLIADEDGLTIHLRTPYYPLRLFQGRGLVGAGDKVFYDIPEKWLPVLAQPNPRYALEGQLETPTMDGREPGCVWHRLLMDACVPVGTQVVVESRAADSEAKLVVASWMTEPAPYLRARGAELPAYRPFSSEELGRQGVGTWELLVQNARGRFAQFRLTLRGSGTSTPRVYVLRAYFPRFSYLRQYMPAVYEEDEMSASFLDRFLANAEGFFTEIEDKIAAAQALFDERTLDPEYFEWLAGWFGTVLDPAFGEDKRRLFLRHAAELYAQRGTHGGLLRMLRLALDPCPDDTLFQPEAVACDIGAKNSCSDAFAAGFGVRVVERFIARGGSQVALGDPTAPVGPRYSDPDEAWLPSQGATRLHTLFLDYLQHFFGNTEALRSAWSLDPTAPIESIRFSPLPPSDPTQYNAWRSFVRNELAFRYAEVFTDDLGVYRAFLERRYRQIERINASYGASYSGFDAIPLPAPFPASEPRLTDWIQFVSLVLPLDREASRFDVMVPVSPSMDQLVQAQQIDLVRRLVEREKPAHTEFDVRPFWALFRVGEARLGLDTLLDLGSRFTALQLGHAALAASFIDRAHPWNVPDRFVTGRETPGAIL